MDARRIAHAAERLGEAALDPALWPEIMENICRGVGATGAILLQGDVRTPDVPRTAGVDALFRRYFAENWHTRDLRARGVPALLRGARVVTDEDCVTAEEMRRHPFYNELHIPLGFQWFAGVGFWADSALWGLCIQRTMHEGPFDEEEKRLLAELSPHLSEAATLSLSTAFGRRSIADTTNALDLAQQPAIALDRLGYVLATNAAADAFFDDNIRVRHRRLLIDDHAAAAMLAGLLDEIRTTKDVATLTVAPIVVRRNRDRPVLIRALPVSRAARSPFVGARVLLILADLGAKRVVNPDLVARVFGLTRAEARLAASIADGLALDAAAKRFGVSRETARAQLKAVFAKTDTHRQGELAALLSRLGWS